MKATKFLFITQEIAPYVPESPLSDLGTLLPQCLLLKNREIRTFMPKWGIVNERRNQLHEVIRLSGMNVIIDDTDHPLIIKVASLPSRIQVYFIDNDDYFGKRQMFIDLKGKEYRDNTERAVFYARGVLETVRKLRWTPQIIHCQGWISGVVPFYIKHALADDPSFRDCKIVFTPSNEELSARMQKNFEGVIRYRSADITQLEKLGKPNIQILNKMGMLFADAVSLTAPNAEHSSFAKKHRKPLLVESNPENYINVYPPFFSKIRGEEEEESTVSTADNKKK